MLTETCNLFRHRYFNPMEYTVYLIRKKEKKNRNRTGMSTASLTRYEREKPLYYLSATTGDGLWGRTPQGSL